MAALRRPLQLAKDVAWTLVLFTYTDFKTIFFPVTVFACVCAPVASATRLAQGMAWIWLHLLQCNVSNQYKTAREDAVNRPWRPMPSGRVSPAAGHALRWALIPLCVAASLVYGMDVALVSAGLTATTLVYDEIGLAGHWIGKNACAVSGYAMFEIGATKIMGSTPRLDTTAILAILCSISIILTTIHAQDCPDVAGDRAQGRVTFPIYAPEGARLVILCATAAWSLLLTRLWHMNAIAGVLFCTFGAYVGLRYYFLRSVAADRQSYLVYNVRACLPDDLWLVAR
ncbi:hypothetical protein EVG20_g8526 [Dentipellis fragilis]|uniref:Uncharacterized protein n=1 Tax=Dentipellis fragilis TaxID=205917 RepID=A0A4Y9Y5R5_9AGAM|nr:hypothetical protein EVG20_g8526 [Dentipellis fragilis]